MARHAGARRPALDRGRVDGDGRRSPHERPGCAHHRPRLLATRARLARARRSPRCSSIGALGVALALPLVGCVVLRRSWRGSRRAASTPIRRSRCSSPPDATAPRTGKRSSEPGARRPGVKRRALRRHASRRSRSCRRPRACATSSRRWPAIRCPTRSWSCLRSRGRDAVDALEAELGRLPGVAVGAGRSRPGSSGSTRCCAPPAR